MSIFGMTKGTEFEDIIEKNAIGEEKAAGLYAALAFLAKEKELYDVSEILMKISTDEARHAGLYAVLNGHGNQEFFEVLKKIAPAETNAYEKLHQLAESVESLGLKEAASHIEVLALDEKRHGEILLKLIEKHSK